MPKKTSVYLSDDLAEAVAASGTGIADLVRRGLDVESVTIRQAALEAAEAVTEDVRGIVREEVRKALQDMRGDGF